MTRVLLIGGAGQLGTAIRRSWTDYEIVAPPHARLALEQIGDLRREIARVRPDVVVNAAAFHDVDRCEEEPERALAVNAVAVGRAAQLAAERGFVFVTISTDYVFDGSGAGRIVKMRRRARFRSTACRSSPASTSHCVPMRGFWWFERAASTAPPIRRRAAR